MTKIVAMIVLVFLCNYTYAQNTDLELQYIEENDSIFFQIKSTSVAPIDIISKQLDTLFPKIVYKELTTVYPNDSVKGFIRVHKDDMERLKKEDEEHGVYDLKVYYGDRRKAKHDSAYLYTLPFEKGKKYEIEQSFFGRSTHKGASSQYAIDFGLKTGEKVYAAREGVVVYAIDEFTEGGKRRELTNKANKIVVLHSDGTFGAYAHLMHKGTLVKKGDQVTKGQHIGYSGSTGYSGGPHLHFVVRLPDDISVPIYFEDYEGQVLKRGKRYKRKH